MASDLDDELLALAESRGRRAHKKKRASNGTSRKSKADEPDSGSDMDVESEDDDWNPAQYPLEGKYIDETDRAKLLALPEIQREEILAQRQEEMQRWRDRVALEKLVKSQSGLPSNDDDSSSKRKPGARDKLDKYKAERRAKEERKQARRDRHGSPSSPRKGRGDSGSSSEDEDGQYSKEDEINARVAKVYSEKRDEILVISDLDKIRMTRNMLAANCDKPWFEKFVTGSFVRLTVGIENGQNVYRICEVLKLGDPVKPYPLHGMQVRETLELKHGTAIRAFSMERVSNEPFTDREFDRLMKTCALEKVRIPSLSDIDRKAAEIIKLKDQRLTDADIDAILARKREIEGKKIETKNVALEFGQITQALMLAQKRNDRDEIQLLKAKKLEIEIAHPEFARQQQASNGNRDGKRPLSDLGEDDDLAARINKRNRQANEESVRRAEAADAERKRRERKLKAEAEANARSKPESKGSLVEATIRSSSFDNLAPLPVAPPSQSSANFDSVVKSIEVDLGDF